MMLKSWTTRADSVAYLEENCSSKLQLINDFIGAIDSTIDCYENLAGTNTYARVCGLTLLKAKNLVLGSYSLILDGLGQEAGALLRPFIEYSELLTYFRNFPDEVDKAADNNLPSAGYRAKAIRGIYKNFRNHLNLHASHSSFSVHSISHLLDPSTYKFKKNQKHVIEVLDRNLRDITIQTFLLLKEAVLSIERLEVNEFEQLAEKVDSLHSRLVIEFKLMQDEEAHG